MADPSTERPITPEFQRGWDAAILAASQWHELQAKRTLIQARRSGFPSNLEREAEVHQSSAEMIARLSPDDVSTTAGKRAWSMSTNDVTPWWPCWTAPPSPSPGEGDHHVAAYHSDRSTRRRDAAEGQDSAGRNAEPIQ